MNKLTYKNYSFTIYTSCRQMDHFSTRHVNTKTIITKVFYYLLTTI
jgi:hypothetical protein